MFVARLFVATFLATFVSTAGCSDPGASKDTSRAASAAASAASQVAPSRIEWVDVPVVADPAAFIQSEEARATADGKKLLVYVGATWCEPCQAFHKAAEKGDLDGKLPALRLVQLDNDRDAAPIEALDCASKWIPMFAVPGPDGHCTTRRIEGGIKGDGTVDYIANRLRGLVGN